MVHASRITHLFLALIPPKLPRNPAIIFKETAFMPITRWEGLASQFVVKNFRGEAEIKRIAEMIDLSSDSGLVWPRHDQLKCLAL